MSTCSTASRALAEPPAATAATARTWLLVEQPGPWGAKALTDSRLDPVLGRALERAAAGTGVRVALIRRPGRRPDLRGPALRRVYLAHTVPGRSWVRTARLAGTDELYGLDAAAMASLGAGDHGGLWEPYGGDPLALVCTNGRRDRCCAVLGRPLAAELAGADACEVWETTHIGGHRFAPTLLVLPYGYAYARLGGHAVKGVLDELGRGRIVTEGCRGRSAWERPGQAADLAVRELTGEAGADALAVTGSTGDAPRWSVTVAHSDGRSWIVTVTEDTDVPPVAASCGAAPSVQPRVTAVDVTPL
ncbi:sucrase ferredoxin [Streptomyces verrucosisporus]|uniref:sucrase ferredoxin n=1 Tax=Streptomyces verrucosisporus TaxID=1695161 RepID=UPI0019D23629|nr:sucrase ferredoxin [Streptomyces verrucosisporus]MBN3931940.1 sucrase ferredoxin [Streptomyces verrucosisporus]